MERLFLNFYLCVWLCICKCLDTYREQKELLDPLELELQASVNCPVMGTGGPALDHPIEQEALLNEPSLQSLIYF